MGTLSIQVVIAATEVGEVAREKGRQARDKVRRNSSISEGRKRREPRGKKKVRNGRATKRERSLGSRQKRLFQEERAQPSEMLREVWGGH